MTSKATTVEQYLNELPEDRRPHVQKLRQTILENLPEGFMEIMAYGMISYVVPHSLYPAGYHCDPAQPLPFLSLASQKHSINIYHSGIYSDPELAEWFQAEYARLVPGKLDMGKSCIRFKKPELIPHELIAILTKKISVQKWITLYESTRRS